eukprot:gene4987-biopygen1701
MCEPCRRRAAAQGPPLLLSASASGICLADVPPPRQAHRHSASTSHCTSLRGDPSLRSYRISAQWHRWRHEISAGASSLEIKTPCGVPCGTPCGAVLPCGQRRAAPCGAVCAYRLRA